MANFARDFSVLVQFIDGANLWYVVVVVALIIYMLGRV